MNVEIYRTTDIVLAASLVVHGNKLVKIDVNGSRGTFVFEDVNEDFLNDYDLGKVLVVPVDFNNQVKKLTTAVRRVAQVR